MPPSRLHLLTDLGSEQLRSRRVFLRVDFNVPMQDGRVVDDTRIREALPTLRHLQEAGARVLLGSHRGRPKGERREEFSLEPIVPTLSAALGQRVHFVGDCVGEVAETAAGRLADGEFCLLENLRFHPGEEANDAEFVAQLAALPEVYVGDAFGTAHRAHASTAGLPEKLDPAVAGLLMAREAEVLGKLLEGPESPYAALLGGAKISGKIETLQRLIESIDVLMIGGGMANTFLAARGHALGASLLEEERLDLAREILARCAEREVEVLLPVDLVVTNDLDLEVPQAATAAPAENGKFTLEPTQMAVDIGAETAEIFGQRIAKCATLFWNGPMGVFEKAPFSSGSRTVAQAVGECEGFTVIGGGETVAAAALADAVGKIDHVSTGGGASLALLAGKTLPGLQALRRGKNP